MPHGSCSASRPGHARGEFVALLLGESCGGGVGLQQDGRTAGRQGRGHAGAAVDGVAAAAHRGGDVGAGRRDVGLVEAGWVRVVVVASVARDVPVGGAAAGARRTRHSAAGVTPARRPRGRCGW